MRVMALSPVAATCATAIFGKQNTCADSKLRFAIEDCEIELTVRSYGKVSSDNLSFIDEITRRRFCAPTKAGKAGSACVTAFRGALSVAQYRFYPSSRAAAPVMLRERVTTIDHDKRFSPRAPEEEAMAVEANAASDIQAFGFSTDHEAASESFPKFAAPWALMRQDLYIDDQKAPILILHWKHTLDSIELVDVIPGDRTRVLSA
jgi:hypothetical protein